jgi:hypothetical protein
VLIEQVLCQGLAQLSQAHRDLSPVLAVAVASQQAVPLQPVEQAGDGGPCDPRLVGKLVGGQPRGRSRSKNSSTNLPSERR